MTDDIPSFEKDGMKHQPFDKFNECGRCGEKLQLTAIEPLDKSAPAVWNDDGWFALHRYLGLTEAVPAKFTEHPDRGEKHHRRGAGLLLCKRCGDQFNTWLTGTD